MVSHKQVKDNKQNGNKKTLFSLLIAVVVLFIIGMLVYSITSDDDTTTPSTENQQTTDNDMNKSAKDEPGRTNIPEEVEKESLQIEEVGSYQKMIEIEGMEETTTVHQYLLEPFNIEYELDQLFNNSYIVEDDSVTYTTESDSIATIRLTVTENASVHSIAEDMEVNFNQAYEDVSEKTEPTDGDNPYAVWRQSAFNPRENESPTFVGYYAYQINEHVLLIEYEYIVEAADGMGPRLQMLIESVREKE